MSKRNISLGNILGIPILLNYSWFLVFGLVTWNLAVSYYPDELSNASWTVYWVMGAVTALMLFGSVLLHELGHSVIALGYKIPVRRITLFLFGGVAEIGMEPPSASAEFFIAIAGPLVSFGLALSFIILQFAFAPLEILAILARYLALINGSLALFNLIPGFPLDGGRIFRSIVWGLSSNLSVATKIAANVGRVISFLFVAFGIWQTFTGDVGGLWFVLIGWYLQSAAVNQLEQQRLSDLFAGRHVSEAMNRSYVLIPAEMPIQHLVDQNLLEEWQRAFVVQRDDKIIGLLSWGEIHGIPRARWNSTTAAQAMISLGRLHSVQLDTELKSAVEEMSSDRVSSLPVVSNGRILGTISREDAMWFLRRVQTMKASSS
jgi:Zn-dependent protease/CBS domain-containing protein